MELSAVAVESLCGSIRDLKLAIAELEMRLQQGPKKVHPAELKSIGVRVHVTAERIDKVLSARPH